MKFRHNNTREYVRLDGDDNSTNKHDDDILKARLDFNDEHTASQYHYMTLMDKHQSFLSTLKSKPVNIRREQSNNAEERTTMPIAQNLRGIKPNKSPIKDIQHNSQFKPTSQWDPLTKQRILASTQKLSDSIKMFSESNLSPSQENSIVQNAKKSKIKITDMTEFKDNEFLNHILAEDAKQTKIKVQQKKPPKAENPIKELRTYQNQTFNQPQDDSTTREEGHTLNEDDDHFKPKTHSTIKTQSRRKHFPKSATAGSHSQPVNNNISSSSHKESFIKPALLNLLRRLAQLNPFARSQFRASVHRRHDDGDVINPITSFSVYHNHSIAPWQSNYSNFDASNVYLTSTQSRLLRNRG
ncbi:hypothetical protein AKO1_003578 [Acrasis kona]|uniref:Uncharacterized protein n=1 Tax=Acrasis kona TaxID=1008807 RepID=A0AAW2Z697_9EUKA